MNRASLRAAIFAALSILVAGGLVIGLLPNYWVYLITAVFILGIALQSLGIVTGRTGMISLCQMSFAGVGAWTVGYLNFINFPGGLPLWLLLGGLAALPFGIIIGLPALRLRGINLAIVTLGFASAFDVVLATITYPGQTSFKMVARPAGMEGDVGYFMFVIMIYALIAVVLEFLNRSRLGASWLAVRHSERAAAAHGVSIPTTKLSAFAISAFIAGVAGGLFAGYLGTLVAENFSMMQSLTLFAVATMAGSQFTLGAIIGGVLVSLFPELLRRLNVPQDFGSVIFAAGAVQALSTGESISETFMRLGGKLMPKGWLPKAKSKGKALPKAKQFAADVPALQVDNVTVRYGNVVASNQVNLTVPQGKVVGLIGPNGAGKSTLVDAITGFLPDYEGDIRLGGQSLNNVSVTDRARLGVRRTWQTTRIAPELKVGEYMRLAAGSDLTDDEIEAVLEWFNCPPANTAITSIDAGTRRLLDVAGIVAARPPVILLDEPAAGQSYAEAVRLGERIRQIPETFGSSVLLIEHDMDLVRSACEDVTVLDFGSVIAHGAPTEVLETPIVQKAYLGVDHEMEASA
jgi:branched-chain amino acid transport system permease protein